MVQLDLFPELIPETTKLEADPIREVATFFAGLRVLRERYDAEYSVAYERFAEAA